MIFTCNIYFGVVFTCNFVTSSSSQNILNILLFCLRFCVLHLISGLDLGLLLLLEVTTSLLIHTSKFIGVILSSNSQYVRCMTHASNRYRHNTDTCQYVELCHCLYRGWCLSIYRGRYHIYINTS